MQTLAYYQRLRRLVYLALFFIFVLLPLLGYWLYRSYSYPAEFLQAAEFVYPKPSVAACAVGERSGLAGSQRLRSADQMGFIVHTPANYRADYAHPLLMVYAPRQLTAVMTAAYTGLTRAATARGFVVVYADSQPLSLEVIRALGQIPVEVASRWCIDADKVVLVGHSDGGTVSSALAFLPDSPLRPAALVISAAGVSGDDLAQYDCPAALPVMVLHGDNDRLFPGYGVKTARWWAACNRCAISSALDGAEGAAGASNTLHHGDGQACQPYGGCLNQAGVQYCAHAGGHTDWPDKNDEIWQFLQHSGVLTLD